MDHLSSAPLPVTHPTPKPPAAPGPLNGLRVIELAHELTAFAGRLLADAGADVILVEAPEGAQQRQHGPFADGQSGLERSLSWWAENTSKRSVVADLGTDDGCQFVRDLISSADIFLESAEPGSLAGFELDYESLSRLNADLIQVAITPFGQAGVGGPYAATDLTVLARGGPMWSCGYDDHSLPPVRGGGSIHRAEWRLNCHSLVLQHCISIWFFAVEAWIKLVRIRLLASRYPLGFALKLV